MGATGVKITVIGAVLAVAVIAAVLMLLNLILDQRNSGSSSDGLDPR
jgi:Flp pilus assembly pilin Flp